MSVADLTKMIAPAMIMDRFIGFGSGSAITYFVVPTYEQNTVIGPMGSALAATVTVNQGSGGTISVLSDASEAFQGSSIGYAPHGLIAVPQGDQMNAADWLKPSQAGSVVLKLNAGSSVGSGSTAEVILQQLRTY